jgi:hypothetical protein
MDLHNYLVQILEQKKITNETKSKLNSAFDNILQDLSEVRQYNPEIFKAGSSGRNIMIQSDSIDLDIAIYFSKSMNNTVEELYEYVFSLLKQKGYKPSIVYNGVAMEVKERTTGLDVDIVVGKYINATYVNLHNYSGFKQRSSLNVQKDYVKGLQAIIRIFKIWRESQDLSAWHKLAMEQTIVRALQGREDYWNNYGYCFEIVLKDIPNSILNAKFFDPTNPNNEIIVNEQVRRTVRDTANNCIRFLQSQNYKALF